MAFRRASQRDRSPFIILEVWGHEKSGKTRLGLTAPPPVYIFNFDKGYDRVEASMLRESSKIAIDPPFKERYDKGLILVTDYSGKIKGKADSLKAEDIENGNQILEQFEKDWFQMVDNKIMAKEKLPPGGTAVIDTGTLIWNIAGHVLRKKAPPNQPWIQYTMRNDFFRRLLASARDSGRNIVFVHHDTDILAQEGGIVGQRPQGDKLVSRAADVIIRMTTKKNPKGGTPTYTCRVEECGLNADVTGEEVGDATWDDLIDLVT